MPPELEIRSHKSKSSPFFLLVLYPRLPSARRGERSFQYVALMVHNCSQCRARKSLTVSAPTLPSGQRFVSEEPPTNCFANTRNNHRQPLSFLETPQQQYSQMVCNHNFSTQRSPAHESRPPWRPYAVPSRHPPTPGQPSTPVHLDRRSSPGPGIYSRRCLIAGPERGLT